jgi:hypothetical protein
MSVEIDSCVQVVAEELSQFDLTQLCNLSAAQIVPRLLLASGFLLFFPGLIFLQNILGK